jgi:hypothetical protein
MAKRYKDGIETEAAEEPIAELPAADVFDLVSLAKKKGHYKTAPIKEDSPMSAAHAVADVLNGWSRHERLTGQVLQLSEANYEAAIEAAKQGKPFAAASLRPKKGEAK